MSTDDTTARLIAAGWTLDEGGYWHSPGKRCLLPPRVAVGVLDEIEAAVTRARADTLAEAVRAVKAQVQRFADAALCESTAAAECCAAAIRALAARESAPTPNRSRFVGPCVHGRDPWTRCEVCVEAGEEQAEAMAQGAREPAGATGEHQPATPPQRMTPEELLRQGGPWLGAARSWLQWNKRNGDRVTWGSNDVLLPAFTARDVDELAAEVAASLWPVGAPPAVLDAARTLTRWHYGEAFAQGIGGHETRCVLVDRKEWRALQRAVEGHPVAPVPSPAPEPAATCDECGRVGPPSTMTANFPSRRGLLCRAPYGCAMPPVAPEPATCDWPRTSAAAEREGRVCRRGLHMVRGVGVGSWDVTEPCPSTPAPAGEPERSNRG